MGTRSRKKARASSVVRSVGNITPNVASSVCIMGMRRHGGLKSISTGGSSGPLAWYWTCLFVKLSVSRVQASILQDLNWMIMKGRLCALLLVVSVPLTPRRINCDIGLVTVNYLVMSQIFIFDAV